MHLLRSCIITKKLITFSDLRRFVDLCESYGIDDAENKTIFDYLNELGFLTDSKKAYKYCGYLKHDDLLSRLNEVSFMFEKRTGFLFRVSPDTVESWTLKGDEFQIKSRDYLYDYEPGSVYFDSMKRE